VEFYIGPVHCTPSCICLIITSFPILTFHHIVSSPPIQCKVLVYLVCHIHRLLIKSVVHVPLQWTDDVPVACYYCSYWRSATPSQLHPIAIISTVSTLAFSIANRNQWIAHNHHLCPLIDSRNIMPITTPAPRFERTPSRLLLHLHGSVSRSDHQSNPSTQ
jgi:hypothetical protein